MSVEEQGYPERVWLERDEETNEKRWFTVPGMGVEYVLATRPEREAQEAVAVPLGAIENGRAFADRLEVTGLACPAGDLLLCADWHEFRRCFEHLAEWALSTPPDAEATIARLQEKVRNLTVLLDQQFGTPCAQIAYASALTEKDVTIARLEKERDEARALFYECAEARDASGFIGTVPQCIEYWLSEFERAEVEAARLREAVKGGDQSRIRRFAEQAVATCDAPDDFSVGYRLAMNAVVKALDGFADIDLKLAALDQPARFNRPTHPPGGEP